MSKAHSHQRYVPLLKKWRYHQYFFPSINPTIYGASRFRRFCARYRFGGVGGHAAFGIETASVADNPHQLVVIAPAQPVAGDGGVLRAVLRELRKVSSPAW